MIASVPTSLPAVAPLWIGPVLVDPPVLQAPMAGYTNFAYRQIVRELGGAGLLATEMIAARSAIWLESARGEHPDRLWGVRDEPRPLAVQMWDNDPDNLAAVGRRLAQDFQVSVVDLNFGCPVRQVTEKAHSGSWLLRETVLGEAGGGGRTNNHLGGKGLIPLRMHNSRDLKVGPMG